MRASCKTSAWYTGRLPCGQTSASHPPSCSHSLGGLAYLADCQAPLRGLRCRSVLLMALRQKCLVDQHGGRLPFGFAHGSSTRVLGRPTCWSTAECRLNLLPTCKFAATIVTRWFVRCSRSLSSSLTASELWGVACLTFPAV